MGKLTTIERLTVASVLIASVAAGILHYEDGPTLVTFAVATVALAGLAFVVSFSTEQVGERFGPAVTGLMQSTLGNLPEFFVVLFALEAGELVVATTSIIGSIFANALLVLGFVIVAGARRADDSMMRFKRRLPNDASTLLLVAVFIIVMVGVANASHSPAETHVKTISVVAAVCLLVVYMVWVIPYMRSDPASHGPKLQPRLSLAFAVTLLALAGLGAAFVSDWFVAALRPAIDELNLSAAFAGIVIVAIAGNAVENVAGIVLAAKGKSDLAISVVKNSVAQVAAFLFPLLVLVSLFFATPLTFTMAAVYIAALLLTAIIVWQITGDGEAAMFEGVALVGLYVVLGTVAYFQ